MNHKINRTRTRSFYTFDLIDGEKANWDYIHDWVEIRLPLYYIKDKESFNEFLVNLFLATDLLTSYRDVYYNFKDPRSHECMRLLKVIEETLNPMLEEASERLGFPL